MRPVPMTATVFPVTSSPRKGRIGMPIAPLVLASQMLGRPQLSGERSHQKEGEFRSRLRQNVGRMSERNFVAVGVGAIDIVETDSNLRDHLELFLFLPRILPHRSGRARW